MMPIPKPKSMEEDWKISVQKALTRTKAPCEIPADQPDYKQKAIQLFP